MATGSWIQKLYTSRDRNNLDFDQTYGNLGNTFVGEVGRLWYNPDSNCLYVSDGVTPGGIPLNTCGNVLGVANISIYDEGNLIASRTSSLDFVGEGVTATAIGNAITITIPGVDTAYPLTIEDEGNILTTSANTINFIGTGVVATNVGNVITVDIPAVASTGVSTYDEGILLTTNTQSYNFVGEGVTANATGNAVTVNVGAGIAYLYSGSFYFDSETTLTNSINSNSTLPIGVVSTNGFSSSGYIRIGTEIIKYTSKNATSFIGISRGQGGSNSSTHDAGDKVSQAQVALAGVPQQVLIDATSISNNVVLDPVTGNVTVNGSGTYNIQFSAQTENFGNDFDDTVVWFVVNGNAIPASASYCSVPFSHGGTPGSNIMTVNIFYTLSAGDVISLWWTSLGGETVISSIPSLDSGVPQSPGVIFTVNRIY